jgi:O-antigen/teichoic acid export membrane protein
MAASVFVLSFSVRKLGAVNYGAIVTITSATALLLVFSGALRYAVIHAGSDASTQDVSVNRSQESVQSAHALFMALSLVLVLIAVSFGWAIPVDLGRHGADAVKLYLVTIMIVGSGVSTLATTAYAGILQGSDEFGKLSQIALVGFAVQVALTVALTGKFGVFGIGWATVGSAIVSGGLTVVMAQKRVPWLRFFSVVPKRHNLRPIVRYAAGLAVLSATSTISSSSDAFVIAAVAGGGAVTIFRVGAIASTTLATLLYSAFGVLFPRLVRSGDRAVQEEGVAWMGRIVGWLTGVAFGSVVVLADPLMRLLLGHPSAEAVHIVWITAGAMAIDVSYHGPVQVIFARAEQGRLAKYTWIELVVNLAATIVLVKMMGAVGSAWALAITIVVTDLVGYPIIMRGHWGSKPGRFVVKNGLVQTATTGIATILVGRLLVAGDTSGVVIHFVLVGGLALVVLASGLLLVGRQGRLRIRGLAGRSPQVTF